MEFLVYSWGPPLRRSLNVGITIRIFIWFWSQQWKIYVKRFCLFLSWIRQANSPRTEVSTNKNKRLSLMKKYKRLSQKLIILKKINPPLPPSKRWVTHSTQILPLWKNKNYKVNKVYNSRTTSVSKRHNKIPQLETRPKPLELIISESNLYVSVLTWILPS